ncbi:MAG: TM2 domain-containing protein [Clostridia bacterium]|nr:TM2 domain-containing protein [Clostridia bacterium]
MDSNKVDMFFAAHQKEFPHDKLFLLREKMLAADEGKYQVVSMMSFKDPTVLLVISLFLGSFGIDRFMLGDTGLGVLKLLTCGVCGIMTIIDWFTVSGKAKEKNFQDLMAML